MENALTVERLQALHEEWRRHPPLPIMVAAYLGIGQQEEADGAQLIERLAAMPGVKRE